MDDFTLEFKFAFLKKCAEANLSFDDTSKCISMLKQALSAETDMEKKAWKPLTDLVSSIITAPVHIARSIAPTALTLGAIGTVGLPVAAGLTAGNIAAKASDDDTDIDEAKQLELINEYKRLTDQISRFSHAKSLRDRL